MTEFQLARVARAMRLVSTFIKLMLRACSISLSKTNRTRANSAPAKARVQAARAYGQSISSLNNDNNEL